MKTPGYLVTTKNGKKGRIFHNKGLVSDKVPVYLEIGDHEYSDKAILCDPYSLTINGYID